MQAATGSVIGLRHVVEAMAMMNVLIVGYRESFYQMRDLEFLPRAIRACLRRANPLTSLLLVSELNQAFYASLSRASGTGGISWPAARQSRKMARGGRSDGSTSLANRDVKRRQYIRK
jgi:hypothetical protein